MHPDSQEPEFIFCLVANVREETPFGEIDIRYGAKGLRRGKKVYCYPPQWCPGHEQIKVLTRLRNRNFSKVYNHKYFCNWRKERVYTPAVIREIGNGWTEKMVDAFAADLNELAVDVDREVARRNR